jgi:non-heme chloroperoxidase
MSIFDELDGAMVAVVRPDGTRLNAVAAGKGPAIVLAHGYGVSSQEFSLVQPALVDKGYRVIAYDQRAHGVSTIGREGASSSALFADLEAVVDHFALDDVTLVGRAMGAFTIIGALASPELHQRTRAAVLAAPETGMLLLDAPLPIRILAAAAEIGLLPPLARVSAVGTYSAAQLCGSCAGADVVEATRRGLASGRRAASGFVGVMRRETVAAQLSGVDLPVTVVRGAEDHAAPSRHAELIVERVPRARHVTVPGAGHMLSFEAPETLVDAIVAASAGPAQPAGSGLARGVSR